MTKSKGFLKYPIIGLVVIALTFAAVAVKFLYGNEAPMVAGGAEYGIKYKDELELDVYRPTTERYERSPVLFFIHGGAWIGGTR